MGLSSLSEDVRKYLARRWYMNERGRPPTADEQRVVAQLIANDGVDAAFASIYDAPAAKAYRTKTGRTV